MHKIRRDCAKLARCSSPTDAPRGLARKIRPEKSEAEGRRRGAGRLTRRTSPLDSTDDFHSSIPPRMRKPSVLIIFLTVFIDLVGFGIVLPLLPIFTRD